MLNQNLPTKHTEICDAVFAYVPEILSQFPRLKEYVLDMEEQDYQSLNLSCKDYLSRLMGKPIFSQERGIAGDADALSSTFMLAICKNEKLAILASLSFTEEYRSIRKLIESHAITVCNLKSNS